MTHNASAIEELDNEWHWGATGTGKSRGTRARYPDAYIKSCNMWWDGYAGEEVVIIDELSPDKVSADRMKMWADHHPFVAESKGGMMRIRPKKIIVTSNYSIEEVYPGAKDVDAIARRFKVHHYPAALGK